MIRIQDPWKLNEKYLWSMDVSDFKTIPLYIKHGGNASYRVLSRALGPITIYFSFRSVPRPRGDI